MSDAILGIEGDGNKTNKVPAFVEFIFLCKQTVSKEISDIFMMCHEENETSNVAESDWTTIRDSFS